MIEVKRITGTIGAEITGVDVSGELSDNEVSTIRDALNDNYVVFFREQKPLSEEEHMRLGRYFGTLDISEIQPDPSANREVLWMEATSANGRGAEYFHRDRTYLEAPPLGSILQCMVRPDVGGDTCWTSSVAAYDALSEPIRHLIDGLTALHSIAPLAARSQAVRDALGEKLHTFPTATHPLVEVHPVTGRKALNINANWTTQILGVSREEARMLLDFLLEHVKRPEFQVRFQWQVGDIAFWDNRTTQHCAIADFNTRRVMKRVALVGHPPKGPETPKAA